MVAKLIVIAIIAVAAVGGAVGIYTVTRAPAETYDLSYRLQAGDYFVQDVSLSMELMGTTMEVSSRTTTDILEVAGDEFGIRETNEMELNISGAEQMEFTSVMDSRMSNKGARSDVQLVSADPPELMESAEQGLGQVQNYLGSLYLYPPDPVAIGQKWEAPLDFQFEESGISATMVGSLSSTVIGKESVTVGAGTFDCLHLAEKITASTETLFLDQMVSINMDGEGGMWVDLESGVQTRVELPLTIEMEATGVKFEITLEITLELVEYNDPGASY